MSISLNGDGIISGVTTFTTAVTGVTTFTNGLEVTGGSVGIGTDNPDEKLEVYGGNIKIDGGGNRWINIDPGSNATYEPRIESSHSLVLRSYIAAGAGVKTCTFNTNGDIDLTGGRNLIFASGNGIDFSATSGTGDSELFDDYEEGNWTPVLNSTSGETYSSRAGTYTKIGNIVHVVGQIVLSNKGSSTGNLSIGTLPFTKRSLDSSRTPFVIYYENLTTSVYNLWGYQDETTRFIIYKVTGTGTNPTLFAHADLANNTVLNFSFVYPTT